MADNLAVTPGVGATIALDEVVDGTLGTVKVQYVKIMDGTLDATTKVASGTGTGNGLRVVVDSSQLAALNTTAQTMSAGFQLTDTPTDGTVAARFGSLTETAPASDTASSGVNGRLQRIAQNITTLIAASLKVVGDIAHAAADSGNPVKQGFKATTSLAGLTLAADANRTNGFAGVDGVQIVRPYCNLEDIVTGRATDTAGTSTAGIAAQAAGIKTYLTSVALANSSATAVTVNILDGASIKYTLSVPAGSGNNKEFTVPIPGTAATAWNFQTSAAATTVTCSMIGFKSKV